MSAYHGGAGTRVAARLIGRDDVIVVVRERWAEAGLGRGGLLLLAGEAGIGKSRMLREIADALGDPSTLTTRAWPRDAEVPGAVLMDLVRALRQESRDDLADALHERLLRVDTGDAGRRHRMLVGDLADLLTARLSEEPTLLQLEDLHWADELSLEVLERLAVSVQATSSLVIGTYRSDEMPGGSALAGWRARLLQQRTAHELPLERLDELGTARLADALVGRMVAREFVGQLHQRSNGIPLHIEELIAAGGTHAVPETVAEAVRQRAAHLDDSTRAVLEAAAVVGAGFEFDALAEIAGEPPEAVDRALRVLLDAQLMVVISPTRYDFRHALIRDAVYEDLGPFRRRALHEAVAAVYERIGARASYLSEHYELANLPDAAHRFALLAARAASAISAHREAADLYERALRTAPEAMSPIDRAALHAAFATELAAIDRPQRAAEHFEAAIEGFRVADALERAAMLCSQLMGVRHLLGDDLEHRVAIADRALRWLDALPGGGPAAARAEVLGAVAAAYLVDDRLDEAATTARDALELAPGDLDIRATLGATLVFAGDAEGWPMLERVIETATGADLEAEAVRGRRMLATSASVLVEYERARTWLDEALDFTAAIERWNDHHYLRAHRAHVRWATGAPGAERDAQRALADGRGITTESQARIVLGYVWLARGRLDPARDQLERALALGRSMRELQRISPALWGLAELAFHEGRHGDALALCEEGLALSGAVSDAAYLYPFVLTGTRAHLAERDLRGAQDWIERTAVHLTARGIPGTLAALDHARGLVDLAQSRPADAREHLERARAAWAAHERSWEGIQSLVDLARVATRSRRPGEAAQLAAEAKLAANAAGAVLLARLADTVKVDRSADPSTGPLTAREYEVAKLIAEGATNREIAERLVIAPKTASAHVEHILAKLGVSRRAEIAAWVMRS